QVLVGGPRVAGPRETGRKERHRQCHRRHHTLHFSVSLWSVPWSYPPLLMLSRNSLLVLVFDSRSISSSIASTEESAESTLRRIHTRLSSSLLRSSSSLRVPLRLMSMEGKMRLSESLRSSTISLLPVPLNSSKMTSSMREPVSTSAVAMMVSEPPSSTQRAAPKKRLGLCRAFESTPPERIFPDDGTTVL